MSKQRFFDSHIHLWDLDHNYYPWLMDQDPEGAFEGYDVIAKTYLVQDYLHDAVIVDVVGATHIQANWDPTDPVGETRWLQSLADANSDLGVPQAIVAFADLSSAGVESILEAHAGFANTRGIRQMLNWGDHASLRYADADHLSNPAWHASIPLLEKYGLSFDAMLFSHQMPALTEVARRHPGTRFIIEHAGMPHEHDDDGIRRWREGMRALAACDNVMTKLSGLGSTIPGWTTELIRPYVLDAIDMFGVERAMIGSNFPTDKMFSDYDTLIGAYLEITGPLSDAERQRLFCDTALEAYSVASSDRVSFSDTDSH